MSFLSAHVVFVTTCWHQVFTAAHLERREQITRDACADSRTGLTEFNGEPSHVRLLVSFPPEVALSRLLNASRACHPAGCARSPRPRPRHYWRTNRLWSGSYFAGSAGGAPVSVLRQYIEQQNRPA